MRLNWLLFFCFVVTATFAQDDIPLMPSDQFESKINLTFKKRAASDHSTFTFADGTEPKKTTDTPIAFLAINFKLLRAEGEEKVNILTSQTEKSSKIKVGSAMNLQFGFIEDLKQQREPTEMKLIFLSGAKKAIRKVTFKIDPDGNYFVNGDKRGKF